MTIITYDDNETTVYRYHVNPNEVSVNLYSLSQFINKWFNKTIHVISSGSLIETDELENGHKQYKHLVWNEKRIVHGVYAFDTTNK